MTAQGFQKPLNGQLARLRLDRDGNMESPRFHVLTIVLAHFLPPFPQFAHLLCVVIGMRSVPALHIVFIRQGSLLGFTTPMQIMHF